MPSKKFLEKMKQRSADLAKGAKGSYDFFMVKEGITRMRPLPVGEDVEFGFEVTTFFLGKKHGTIISAATFGEKCPIINRYNKLKDSKDESDNKLAARFKPSPKIVMPHIKYKDENGKELDTDNGAKLALLSKGCYQQTVDLFIDPEQGDFTDPIEGYDLKYKRTGKGKQDTVYTVTPCKPTKLPKEFRKIYDPETMVREMIKPYDEALAIIREFIKDPGEDSDDEPKKDKKGTNSKKKKRKSNL